MRRQRRPLALTPYLRLSAVPDASLSSSANRVELLRILYCTREQLQVPKVQLPHATWQLYPYAIIWNMIRREVQRIRLIEQRTVLSSELIIPCRYLDYLHNFRWKLRLSVSWL